MGVTAYPTMTKCHFWMSKWGFGGVNGLVLLPRKSVFSYRGMQRDYGFEWDHQSFVELFMYFLLIASRRRSPSR